MPIEISARIVPYDQKEFHALDQRIMRVVFDVHSEFGRLLDEELYKGEIAARCVAMGIQPVEREVRVRVSHESFTKDYFMDLLLCHGLMVEGKAVDRLVAAHRSQCLNYLLLTGLKHGRLVNFRTQGVQHEFVSTTLTLQERRRFSVVDDEWVETPASLQLKAKTLELLDDWGAFLDVNLYREGLVHFLGGSHIVARAVEIFSGSRKVGTQTLNMLDPDTASAVTTKQNGATLMRDHLERLLHHTQLRSLQWINLNRHRIEFTTLMRR